MPVPEVPAHTLRSLAMMLRVVCFFAWRNLGRLFARAKPPCDLVVTTSSGARFSGVLVVENNSIIGGVAHLTGAAGTPTPKPAYDRPRSLFDHEEHEPWE